MKSKILYRSQKNRVIAGVLGGLADYIGIDANLLRLIWIVLTAITGFIPGIVAYILAALIIPQESK